MLGDPASPAAVCALLERYGLRSRKGWGQNFLADPNTVRKILVAARLSPDDLVVEIGPGLGALTVPLAASVRHVVAVEIDRNLVAVLKDLLAGTDNVTLVCADAVEVDYDRLVGEVAGRRRYKVVSNLPYYITSPFLAHLLQKKFNVEMAVIMVQEEVARRLVAGPGSKDYGSISVMVQYYARPEILFRVSRNVFIPRPEVDSAVVRLVCLERPAVEVEDEEIFWSLVRGAFGQRRKTILNALSGRGLGYDKVKWREILRRAGIDPQRRGETLSLEEYARLAGVLLADRRKSGRRD